MTINSLNALLKDAAKLAASVFISMVTMVGAAIAQPVAEAAQIDSAEIKSGIAAYRAGDYAASWRALKPIAASGDVKAQRYVAFMLLSDEKPAEAEDEVRSGAEALADAARAGDYVSLVKLEEMRRAGHRDAPSLAEIIDIETVRAERGDPVTAWRLANRYETGEGVEASQADAEKWLSKVATADAARFPKTREAAFRLCEMHAVAGQPGSGDATKWCSQAAEHGHAGAAIMLRRIAQLAK